MKAALVVAMFLAALFGTAVLKAEETKKKCVLCMTQHDIENRDAARARIQKELDDLRAKVKRLEAENDALRNRAPVFAAPRTETKIVERRIESKSPVFTIFGGVGAMPDGVYIDAKDRERKAQIHEYGTALQYGAMYHFESGLSLGANGAVTTRDTHLQSYFGTLGYSFGSR